MSDAATTLQSHNPLPMFVIGLESKAHRYKECLELFAQCDLFPEFVEGVDGAKPIELREGESLGYIRRGAAGCALAHYRLWTRLLAEGHDRVAIFEDDAKPTPDFARFLKTLVNVDSCAEYISVAEPAYENKNRDCYRKLFSLPLDSLELRLFLYPYETFVTRGYVINRTGLEKLVAHFMPVHQPVDVYISNCYQHHLRIYALEYSKPRKSRFLVKDTSKNNSIIWHYNTYYADNTEGVRFLKTPLKWLRIKSERAIHRFGMPWLRRLYVLRHADQYFMPGVFSSRWHRLRHIVREVRL